MLISAATAWEIATKHRLGMWQDARLILDGFRDLMRRDRFIELPISIAHATMVAAYGWPHRDPFDRLLAAQAEIEGVPLVSGDETLRRLGVAVLWRDDDTL